MHLLKNLQRQGFGVTPSRYGPAFEHVISTWGYPEITRPPGGSVGMHMFECGSVFLSRWCPVILPDTQRSKMAYTLAGPCATSWRRGCLLRPAAVKFFHVNLTSPVPPLFVPPFFPPLRGPCVTGVGVEPPGHSLVSSVWSLHFLCCLRQMRWHLSGLGHFTNPIEAMLGHDRTFEPAKTQR